jgi:peptide deformylase|tara:strand:- start:390 stop:941 length:552 start_codon:yes stop_codon:yes gene_type:complete
MKELKLIPPSDPRVQTAIAPFDNSMLKDEGFKDRKELTKKMYELMAKYGGIGLSANQIGLPFNMFVLGDHPSLENGMKLTCFNPMIISSSKEEVVMEEGCLTFPFVFLKITRPRKVVVKYTDENDELKEGQLDGMMSRIFQHEYEHMLGRTFVENASKLKLDRAYKKAEKLMDKVQKQRALTK